MKMHLCRIIFPSVLVLLSGCTPKPLSTVQRMASFASEGRYMYGHQDDLCYGHTWYLEEGRSDVKDVCGDYPAIVGFDLAGLEKGSAFNIDSVPFDYMRKVASEHIARGGIVAFSWHTDNPLTGGNAWDISSDKAVESVLQGGENFEKFRGWLASVGDFISSIGEGGIIFRPYHENIGTWFWWGGKLCTAEQYKALWKMTYDYLAIERGLDMAWAYSPNSEITYEQYMSRYPGDDMVDILGLDAYQYCGAENYITVVQDNLDFIRTAALERGKLFALTETGLEGIPDARWWTDALYKAVDGTGICYVLTWRNACDRETHFYGPFRGALCEDNFKEFYNSDKTLFLNDIR